MQPCWVLDVRFGSLAEITAAKLYVSVVPQRHSSHTICPLIRRTQFGSAGMNANGSSGLKLVHGVLVDLPVLHNEIEILGGVSHEVEILQWVTVNQEKVRQCAFLNDPELAWIWIAET